jgi:hypothetical protein
MVFKWHAFKIVAPVDASPDVVMPDNFQSDVYNLWKHAVC